jgi:hypothetical protein
LCLPFPKSATGHYPLHAVTLENLQQSSFRRWCHNSTACSIPSNDIRTLPELHGNAYAKLDTSSLYLPHRYHPYWRFTKYHNRKFFSKGGKKARQYQGTTGNPSTVLCLGHAISTTANITTRTSAYWHLIITTASSALAMLLTHYCSLRSKFHHLCLRKSTTNDASETNPTPQTSSNQAPVTEHRKITAENEHRQEVSFTTYLLQKQCNEVTHFIHNSGAHNFIAELGDCLMNKHALHATECSSPGNRRPQNTQRDSTDRRSVETAYSAELLSTSRQLRCFNECISEV